MANRRICCPWQICAGCSWITFSKGNPEEAWQKYGRRGRCLKCQRDTISKWRKEDPEKHRAYLLRYNLKRKNALV